jgi:FAD/FMN-containing dehydrogenase/Fe-S oxidoreductase
MPPLPVLPGRSTQDTTSLFRRLASTIEGEFRADLHNRMLYATDASLYQVPPLAVVIPASVEDAVRALDFCREHHLPILPRGGGTSLAGQCTNRAVVIDFSARCRSVLSVDAPGLRCSVEPGITVDDLNEALAPSGVFFAPDPATSKQANIGGCIGNNAAGGRSILYGRTSENLDAVTAWIPRVAPLSERCGAPHLSRGAAARDPRLRDLTLEVATVVIENARLIRERFPRTIRRNAGYALDMILDQIESAGPRADADAILGRINLAHLLCGSEGTLGVTLGADLRLNAVPRAKGLAVIGLADLDHAIALTVPILGTGPSAVELLDDTILDLAGANAEYQHYVRLMPAPREGTLRAVLYVEYFSTSPDPTAAAEEIHTHFSQLALLLAREAPAAGLATFTDAKSMAAAWKLRKAGEPLLHGMPGDRKPITFVEDNAVPVGNLSRFVREFRRIVQSHGTNAAFWAHASVGVLHVRPFVNIRDEGDQRIMQRIAVEVADLARDCGGIMSGEHGDGRARGPLLERYFGPELMAAFRRIKSIFDPDNLLNPGMLVEPGPIASITESTRVKPAERLTAIPPVDTYFEYEDQQGFQGAVEMCKGAGVCRKRSGGTMCPSYMATMDERHSTRGRGNALRLAITGQLADEWSASHGGGRGPLWNDPGTMETLNLCLSCKACKTECPSNVDIARLKAEYAAQRYRTTGAPLQARAFGHIRTLNRLGSIAPPVANWTNRQPLVRAILNKALNLAPQRTIPGFAKPLTRQWRRPLVGRALSPPGPRVALFADCFTTYNEPRIGLATRRVLGAFGYEVELINAGCCARALISTGLLGDAILTADATLERLRPAIDDPDIRAILVCEPSCLSSFKDDWLQLKLRTPRELRLKLAAKSFLPEDFLERHWDSHPQRPVLGGAGVPPAVLFHGHCHQKALWGNESSAAFLRRLAPDTRVLDSGCCGMAGSFGYTADRYRVSMAIGERTLFPSVRAAPGARICATGTSCRHQIKDGTGRRALHPMELAAALIDG